MRIFESARIRLTIWYLVLIAFISLSFSAVLYNYVSWELEQGFRMAEYHFRGQPVPKQRVRIILQDELNEAKKDVIVRLLFINGIIVVVSGALGYFLAGKTLSPIKDMIDEQKRFIADASHELRTPLTSMKTEIEVALRNKKLTKKGTKELLQSNLQEVDKMKELANYLLSLSRYESNGQDIELKKLNLIEPVKEAVEKNLPQAKNKKIKIKTNLKKVYINGSETSLSELFSILIDNAIKYSPKGGTVKISIKKSKRKAIVLVKDQGVGISKEDIPHIFDRFFRSDTSRTKQKSDGYGLGLSIAKSIVEFHKGDINVKSKVGKGTTFKTTFPKTG